MKAKFPSFKDIMILYAQNLVKNGQRTNTDFFNLRLSIKILALSKFLIGKHEQKYTKTNHNVPTPMHPHTLLFLITSEFFSVISISSSITTAFFLG